MSRNNLTGSLALKVKKMLRTSLKVLFKYTEDRKYLKDWISSFREGRAPFTDNMPLMPYRTREWLESYITPESKVFEYGSGGSTLWLSDRGAQVHSVEHHPQWAEIVRTRLDKENRTNCILSLIEPKENGSPKPYTTESKRSHKSETLDFSEYVDKINEYEDGTFDLVIVDGRARISCVLTALPKVKKGGYLLLDDSQRKHYQPAFELLKDCKKITYRGLAPYKDTIESLTVWHIDG